MTSDELKAAAERRCSGGSVGFTNGTTLPSSVVDLLADVRLLADAYLAERWCEDVRVLRLHAAILSTLPYIETPHVRSALLRAVDETKQH